MSQNRDNFDIVRSGFTAQQFVLILVTFLLGMASATIFNDLLVERSFGPASVAAAQDSQESK
jgi:uncharacterized membrane protein